MDEEFVETNKKENNYYVILDRRIERYLQLIAIAISFIVLAIISLLLYSIRRILGIFALAFLASYIVSPAVRFFEKRGLNRLLVVGLLYIIFVAVIVISAIIFLPMIGEELGTLQYNIQNSLSDPELAKTISDNIDAFQEKLSEIFPQIQQIDLKSQINIEKGISGAASWIMNYIGQLMKAITTYSGKVILIGVAIFLIPFITFFLLKDGKLIKQALLAIVPARYTKTTQELFQIIDHQIGRFIRGKIAESIILSILTIIGLRILNIKYYLVIGSVAGFANLIPYIGPVGIAIPPILLAIYQYGILHAIITGIFLSTLQIIDNMILVPFIVGKSVDLHPIVTVFVVFVGGQILGLLGMVAAVPIASILISIFQAVYNEFKSFSKSKCHDTE
ncbi:MAG: AI-2E family transporter [bacterium]